MKKLGFSALALGGMVVPALADGTTSVTIPSAASIDGVASAVTTWATAAVPTLITIASCFLGFYLLKFGIRAIKSVAGASK